MGYKTLIKSGDDDFFADRIKSVPQESFDKAKKFFSDKLDYLRMLQKASLRPLVSEMKSSKEFYKKASAFEQVNYLFAALEYYRKGELNYKHDGITQPFTSELNGQSGIIFPKDMTLVMPAADFTNAKFFEAIKNVKIFAPEYKNLVEGIEKMLGFRPQRISRMEREEITSLNNPNRFSKYEAARITKTKAFEKIDEFFFDKTEEYNKVAELEAQKYFKKTEPLAALVMRDKARVYTEISLILYSMDFLAINKVDVELNGEIKKFNPNEKYPKNAFIAFNDTRDAYRLPESHYNKTYLKELVAEAKKLTPENIKQIEKLEEMFNLSKKNNISR